MLTRILAGLLALPAIASADRTTEIQVDALGLLDGRYALSLDHAIAANAALSVELDNSPDGDYANRGVMVSLPIYASRLFDGFFVAPGVAARGTWANTNSPAPDVSSELTAQVVIGWAWLTREGLSIAAALGVEDGTVLWTNGPAAATGIEPTGYVRVGYAFQ